MFTDSLLSDNEQNISEGNVCIMTHSFFSDVIRIGFTDNDPVDYALTLSQSTPGNYSVVFSLKCKQASNVAFRIKEYLSNKKYVNEFYEVSPKVAEHLLKRETLRIPVVDMA
ncbi:GIY-YIG nuclease family protein [Litorilituus lipolyticus]|nr:GIY-YIG nuclease family protein [Litorilituus lipolyticus]